MLGWYHDATWDDSFTETLEPNWKKSVQMRNNHMCRRDRRQLTRKKKLGTATACSHSHINLCHIENFSPSERVSPYSCISTVHTKEQKRNRGSGPYISARVSIVCPRELLAQHRSHHQGVGHNTQQQTLSTLCRGSGCCGSWAAPWPQARRWLAEDLVGAVLLVQEG